YPPITVIVNVSANAAPALINSASVSGGGSLLAIASDLTTIDPVRPSWSILKAHSGSFTQGQQGAVYTITVFNTGMAATSGQVTVADNIPGGLTPVSMSGTGWTCNIVSCSRSDALPFGQSFPPITFTVNVASNAQTLTNQAIVSGGGAVDSAAALDPTTINPLPVPAFTIRKMHSGNFTRSQAGAFY